MAKLELHNNQKDAIRSIQLSLNSALDELHNQWILEAGCGSLSRIELPKSHKIAGIDISQAQLDRNTELSEKICADIVNFPLTPAKYQVCICWNVLEHIPEPKAALQNLTHSLKDDGLLILAVPNIHSLKGLVTKYTPHWFHVWYYKNILGSKSAERPDRAPFRAFLNADISPTLIQEELTNKGFQIEKLIFFDAMVYRLSQSHFSLYFIYNALSTFLKICSFGKRGGKHNSEFVVVAKKISN